MMRTVPFLAGVVASLLTACQAEGGYAGAPRADLVGELNQKSTVLTGDTIHVFSAVSPEDPYGGTRIDSRHYDVLKRPYRRRTIGGFYISHRVQLEPGYTGYLLRRPSRYTSSGIDLWIYQEDAKSWMSPVRVADAYGGGSWQYALDGWLVDVDGDRHRDLVQRHRYWWTDDAFEEHEADSLFVRRGQHATFAEPQLSNDTTMLTTFLPARWRK